MSKIGIFWVYKDTVIGKACEQEAGEENVPGWIDSPDSHIGLWERHQCFLAQFSELQGTEYQDVPRGRVIYSTKDKKTIIYLDKVLHTEQTKKIITDFFELRKTNILWKADKHYRTESGNNLILSCYDVNYVPNHKSILLSTVLVAGIRIPLYP